MKHLLRATLAFLALTTSASAQPSWPYTWATPIVSSAIEGSHILKTSPGSLFGLYVTASATPGFILTFNSTTVPADGPVTPINCVAIPANTTVSLSFAPQPPEFYSVGIIAVFSSTGCFTKTISATAFFHALVQ